MEGTETRVRRLARPRPRPLLGSYHHTQKCAPSRSYRGRRAANRVGTHLLARSGWFHRRGYASRLLLRRAWRFGVRIVYDAGSEDELPSHCKFARGALLWSNFALTRLESILRALTLQPASVAGIVKAALAGVSAAVAGYSGLVLVGGPVSRALPSAEALVTGALLAAVAFGVSWHSKRDRLFSGAAASLLATLPFLLFAAVMHLSPSVAHFATQTSALGWVLLPALLLAQAAAYRQATGVVLAMDVAYGGAAGIGCAALLQVAIADGPLSLHWAFPGWMAGAAVVAGLLRVAPRPATRLRTGVGLRTLPTAAAWITALITTVPAAPRHEIATSAGAQSLALFVAGLLILVMFMLWRSEFLYVELSPLERFRHALDGFAPGIATLALLLVGGFQAASYSEITIDDLGQFWATADAVANGENYPIWRNRASLPGLPILLLGSFSLFGRTFPAALAPMFLANVLLPWLIYRAALSAKASRSVSFAIAVVATVLPPVQIYSLGSAEPDPVFIALLAAAAWGFVHVLRSSEPRHSILALGVVAAALAVTRPEGPLYAGLLPLAAFAAKPSRWTGAGVAICAVLVLPLVVFSMFRLGRPWPVATQDFSIANLVSNTGIVGSETWPKVSRLVLLNDIRFPLLIAAILLLCLIGSIHLARRRWAYIALPAAVIANIVVKLGISVYMVRLRPDAPQEFIRHVAYPMPIVAVLAAVGATALAGFARKRGELALRTSQAIGLAVAVYLAAGSLYILGTPEEFHHGNKSGSLLSASIYVNAPELWRNPIDLPPPDWSFAEFRRELFAWYEPFDNHSVSTGAAYQTLTGAAAAAGLAALLVAAPTSPARSNRRFRTSPDRSTKGRAA